MACFKVEALSSIPYTLVFFCCMPTIRTWGVRHMPREPASPGPETDVINYMGYKKLATRQDVLFSEISGWRTSFSVNGGSKIGSWFYKKLDHGFIRNLK
jgi:hypothetical protein